MQHGFSKLFLEILATTLLILSNTASAKCGVYRWSDLTSLTAPTYLPQSNRVFPVETEVFQIQANLTEINQTDDLDYHLLIADSSGHKPQRHAAAGGEVRCTHVEAKPKP